MHLNLANHKLNIFQSKSLQDFFKFYFQKDHNQSGQNFLKIIRLQGLIMSYYEFSKFLKSI